MRKCLHAVRFLPLVALTLAALTATVQGRDPAANAKSASRPAARTSPAPRPHPRGSHFAPAITATDTHGVKSSVALSDYRGKWVILEFWSVWCGPCVREGIPGLMRFYDRHQDQRDRFQVLTVHDANGSSYAHVGRLVDKISKRYWRSRTLPFPIIFDTTAQTLIKYGIEYLPAQVLIDPDGYIAATGAMDCERVLERALQAERAVSVGERSSGKAGR